MASIKNLKASWNFDKVSGSNSLGKFEVRDVSNVYYGSGHGFAVNNKNFILKQDIRTNKKLQLETLEGPETIQILEEDDERVNELEKPSSVQLLVENSMYQVISDEMLNLFSTIDAYAFKFIEPYNKYKPEYNKLEEQNRQFFSKILEKPNLEKYTEFYKWIDSSLGDMIDQLKPENSNSNKGLKNTIESHILERNKFEHKLPLVISNNRFFSHKNSINARKATHGAVTDGRYPQTALVPDMIHASSSMKNIAVSDYKTLDIENKNYTKIYESIQAPGKILNNRNKEENKTVFLTRFSNADYYSEVYKDPSGEISPYSDSNSKRLTARAILNYSESNILGTRQGKYDITGTTFEDNYSISRNIPWTGSNYHTASVVSHIKIPSEKMILYRQQNTNFDLNNLSYELSRDVTEPPIEFNIPVMHNLNIYSASQEVTILSPYENTLNTFSLRNIGPEKKEFYRAQNGNLLRTDPENTFLKIVDSSDEAFSVRRQEHMNIIYPRKDKIGLAHVRTRDIYEEEKNSITDGINASQLNGFFYSNNVDFIYWATNSYNRNSAFIRTFWNDNFEKRKTTRAKDAQSIQPKIGSYNCYDYAGKENNLNITLWKTEGTDSVSMSEVLYNNKFNTYNSLFCMDAYSDTTNVLSSADGEHREFRFTVNNEVFGDLSPYSNFYLPRFLINFNRPKGDTTVDIPAYPVPKPTFIHTIFHPPVRANSDLNNKSIRYILNNSYIRNEAFCGIKPWYNSYEEFRENFRNNSQKYSIIPEFNVSNYESILGDDSVSEEKYLKKLGTESEDYDVLEEEYFIADFHKFVSKKSNKIRISGKAIKKILPYKGFYPQDRAIQTAAIFSKEYLEKTVYNDFDSKNSLDIALYQENVQKNLCVLQPLFSPGILFNSIKSGIGVAWPVSVLETIIPVSNKTYGLYPTTNVSEDSKFIYNKTYDGSIQYFTNIYFASSDSSERIDLGEYVVSKLNYRFPFETILKPYENFSACMNSIRKQRIKTNNLTEENPTSPNVPIENGFCLTYLDPTHYSKNILTDVRTEDLMLVKANLKNAIDTFVEEKTLYISAINNFLAEIANFFLDNQTATFYSAEQAAFKAQNYNKIYIMDVVLKKHSNFSMFTHYNTSILNDATKKTEIYIPPHSLFGPPVKNSIAFIYSDYKLYLPYVAPYLTNIENVARVTIKYSPQTLQATNSPTTVATIEDILERSVFLEDYNDIGTNGIKSGYDTANNIATLNKMSVKDCIYFIKQGDKIIIKTKFESPVLNFKNNVNNARHQSTTALSHDSTAPDWIDKY